jgi:hypothetical protein
VTTTDRASAPAFPAAELPPWCKPAPAGAAADDGPPLPEQLFDRLVNDLLLRSLPARPDLVDDLPTLARLTVWAFVSRLCEETMRARVSGGMGEDQAQWVEGQARRVKEATHTVAKLDALAGRMAAAAKVQLTRQAEQQAARDLVRASAQLADELRQSRAIGVGAVPVMPIG